MSKAHKAEYISVTQAVLHSPVTIVGSKLGVEKTLNAQRIPHIKMGWSKDMGGLIVKVRKSSPPGATQSTEVITALVPAPNVVSVVFEEYEQENY